jgi:hypothetical protein
MLAPNSTVTARDHGTEKLELAEKIGVVVQCYQTEKCCQRNSTKSLSEN